MVAVLGIDAAWTEYQPSGMALLSSFKGAWNCVAVTPSYATFMNLTQGGSVDWGKRVHGSTPQPHELIAAAERLLKGESVTVIAVDMPISKQQIVGRREADNAVSKAFGNKGCGTHTPNSNRPGPMGRRLTDGFRDLGYSLAVKGTQDRTSKHIIEVYPHPALLALLKANFRIPYKVGKTKSYWPNDPLPTRIQKLQCEHHRILDGLRSKINGIESKFPKRAQVKTLSSLKPYEDAVDALICAWVGIMHIHHRAKPYGDENAAIWIPG